MDETVLAAFAEKGLLLPKEVAHWRRLFRDLGPTRLSPSSHSMSERVGYPTH